MKRPKPGPRDNRSGLRAYGAPARSVMLGASPPAAGWQKQKRRTATYTKICTLPLEDYPLADYILSSTPLRKLDDALHRMRSFVRRTAIPAWSAFLGCELQHCYRSTILAFSYSRHQCSSSMSSHHPSSTSPLLLRRPYASSATVIHDSVKVGLGDCSSALATIT